MWQLNRGGYQGRDGMEKKTCEVCGHEIELGALEEYRVVPTQLTEQASMPESRVANLCSNCHQELHKWYLTKVSDMAYDTEAKRFRTKSPLEMIREYEATFDSFVRYKQKQRE